MPCRNELQGSFTWRRLQSCPVGLRLICLDAVERGRYRAAAQANLCGITPNGRTSHLCGDRPLEGASRSVACHYEFDAVVKPQHLTALPHYRVEFEAWPA